MLQSRAKFLTYCGIIFMTTSTLFLHAHSILCAHVPLVINYLISNNHSVHYILMHCHHTRLHQYFSVDLQHASY